MDVVNIQLWIGTSFVSKKEYLSYFEDLNDEEQSGNPLALKRQFEIDIDDLHDPEKLVCLPRLKKPVPIADIIQKINVNEEEKPRIANKCASLGLTSANATFWYINDDTELVTEPAKPYKESYNGLKYIGQYAANSQYKNVTPQFHPRLQHVWIGNNFSSAKVYSAYFKLDYKTKDIDSPQYKVCGFCQDLGIRWYDEDLIAFPRPLKKALPISKLLNKFLGTANCIDQIVAECKKRGIDEANALAWYDAEDLKIKKPYRFDYNGLQYIGRYPL